MGKVKDKKPKSLEDFINEQDWLSEDIRKGILELPEDVQGKLCAEIDKSKVVAEKYIEEPTQKYDNYLELQSLKYQNALKVFKVHPVSIELYRENELKVNVPLKFGDFERSPSARGVDEDPQSLLGVLQPGTVRLIKQREADNKHVEEHIEFYSKCKSELMVIQQDMNNLFHNEAFTDQLKKTTSLEGSKLSKELKALVEEQKKNKFWTKEPDVRYINIASNKIKAEMKAVQKSLRKINKEADKGPISKLINYLDSGIKAIIYPKDPAIQARFEAAKFMLSEKGIAAMKNIKEANKESLKIIGDKISHVEKYHKSKKPNAGRGV